MAPVKEKDNLLLRNLSYFMLAVGLSIGLVFLLKWWIDSMTTNPQIERFECTGTIGDTIGGLTAPIIGIFGSILVFFAFLEQLRANKMQFTALIGEIERGNAETLRSERDRLFKNHLDIFLEIKKDFGNIEFNITSWSYSPIGTQIIDGVIKHNGIAALEEYLIRHEISATGGTVRFHNEIYSDIGLLTSFVNVLNNFDQLLSLIEVYIKDENDKKYIYENLNLYYDTILKPYAVRLFFIRDPYKREITSAIKSIVEKLQQV